MGDSSLHAARIQRPRRELKEDAGAMGASAHWRDEGDLITVSDLRVPVGELLVERDTDRALVGLQPWMQLLNRFVYVGNRRPGRKLDVLGVSAGLLAQPGEEARAHGDRDSHRSMLLSGRMTTQEDMYFLA